MSGTENDLNNEEKLLFSLCRLDFSPAQKSQISGLIKEVTDWKYFIDLANGHGIIALCWFNITSGGYDKDVPSDYLKLLHSGYYKTLTRNVFLKNIFEEIIGLAEKAGIRIMPIKGMALEQLVYGNRGLRQMSDIDILVEMDKALYLRDTLLKNGYSSVPLISGLHKSILPYLKRHLPVMEKSGVLVEIHVKLFEQEDNNLSEGIFRNSYKNLNSERNFFLPEMQVHFLYLVQHICNHENKKDLKLKLYLDLALLISAFREKILNEKIVEYSLVANLNKELFEKLKILEIFWQLSLPERFERVDDSVEAELISQKFIRLIKDPFQDNSDKITGDLFKPFRKIPGLLNKILFLAGYVIPSLTYMQYYYKTGSKLSALIFYPVRWWRLLRLAAGEKGLKV
jgi:hypothetical protein